MSSAAKKDDAKDKKTTAEPMEVDGKDATDKGADKPSKSIDALTVELIRDHCRIIERSEAAKEPRQILRVLRQLLHLRKQLNASVLHDCIQDLLPPSAAKPQGQAHSTRGYLLKFIKDRVTATKLPTTPTKAIDIPGAATPMEVDGAAGKSPRLPSKMQRITGVPTEEEAIQAHKLSKCAAALEIEAYIQLLMTLYLVDCQRQAEAIDCISSLVARIESLNRRSMDCILARAYYYHNILKAASDARSELTFLLGRLKVCTLRGDYESVATLINSILHTYLTQNMYTDAEKFFSKVTMPASANNNEMARYVYHTGVIKAFLFDYESAEHFLSQALQKAPQNAGTAIGFKMAAQKIHIVVTLLRGEIPDRSLFRIPTMKKALAPYLLIANAVRQGDLKRYTEVCEHFALYLQRDGTASLIARLKKNVLLTALKQISVVYSRIRLVDIQKKLDIDSVNDAKCIVSSAILHGVLNATVNVDNTAAAAASHQADDAWYMKTNEPIDIYSTEEPQIQFDERTNFCLEMYNASVKALRFPNDEKNINGDNSEEQRERELAEMEMARQMAEEEDDDDY